jgi:hypothetical protein
VAAARQPEHPASVLVRGDVLLAGVLEVFARRLFSPQRHALLAQDLPKVARGEVTAWEARLQALQRTLADLQGRQARLVRTLEERDDPGGALFEQIARRLGELDREQQAKLAELRAVLARRPDADEQAVDLLELLPLLTPTGWLRRPSRCCAPCSSGSSCRSATTSRRTGRPCGSRSATTASTAC